MYKKAFINTINAGNALSRHWESEAISVVNSVFNTRLEPSAPDIDAEAAYSILHALPPFYQFTKPALQQIHTSGSGSDAYYLGLAPKPSQGFQSWYYSAMQLDRGVNVVFTLYQALVDPQTKTSVWVFAFSVSLNGTWLPAVVKYLDGVSISNDSTAITDPDLRGTTITPTQHGVSIVVHVQNGIQFSATITSARGPVYHAKNTNVVTSDKGFLQNSCWSYPDGQVVVATLQTSPDEKVLEYISGTAWFEYQQWGLKPLNDFDILLFASSPTPHRPTWMKVVIQQPELQLCVNLSGNLHKLSTFSAKGIIWRANKPPLYNCPMEVTIHSFFKSAPLVPNSVTVAYKPANLAVTIQANTLFMPPMQLDVFTIPCNNNGTIQWVMQQQTPEQLVTAAKLPVKLSDAFETSPSALAGVTCSLGAVVLFIIALIMVPFTCGKSKRT